MNKETDGDDLGLTLQAGFVTKALLGRFGSDKFRLAVSADGASFFDGLTVDNATGIVGQPRLPRVKGYTNFDNYVGVDVWTRIAINSTESNDQGAFDTANNRFVAPVNVRLETCRDPKNDATHRHPGRCRVARVPGGAAGDP